VLLNPIESNATPKSTRILEQIRSRIQSGVLKVGEILPSTRHLAQQLGIHRSTAYQELWSLE
jgi:DNA-binding GntR family transcriptional regulator